MLCSAKPDDIASKLHRLPQPFTVGTACSGTEVISMAMDAVSEAFNEHMQLQGGGLRPQTVFTCEQVPALVAFRRTFELRLAFERLVNAAFT